MGGDEATWADTFCGINLDGIFEVNNEDECWCLACDCVPATKEQRDFFFQKMKESGYIFDFEKKELKKIEQEPAWSEEDEEILYSIINDIEIRSGRITLAELKESYTKQIDWLKSLRPQNRWKPSDEQMKALVGALSLAKNCGEESAFDLRTLYEQLEKLREE